MIFFGTNLESTEDEKRRVHRTVSLLCSCPALWSFHQRQSTLPIANRKFRIATRQFKWLWNFGVKFGLSYKLVVSWLTSNICVRRVGATKSTFQINNSRATLAFFRGIRSGFSSMNWKIDIWYHEYARFNEPRFLHCTPQQDSQCNYGNGTTNMRRLSRLRRVHPDKDGVSLRHRCVFYGAWHRKRSLLAQCNGINYWLTYWATHWFWGAQQLLLQMKARKALQYKNQYMNKRNNPKKGQRRLLNNSIYRQKIEKKDK